LPVGITSGLDGNLWFTDTGATPAIGRITPSGEITEFDLDSSSSPLGITSGPDGNLWFTDTGATPAIGRIASGGEITEYDLSSKALPTSVAAGCGGDAVWLADSGASRAIGRVTPAGVVTEFPTGLESSPYDLTCGSDGNLWFTLPEGSAIGRFGTGRSPKLTVKCVGAGAVSSSPATSNLCGAKTVAEFAAGTTVALAASPDEGWLFEGWSGDCSGDGGCEVTMNTDRSVTATFAEASA